MRVAGSFRPLLLSLVVMSTIGLIYMVDMIVSTAPTANNVVVMAELVGENKQGNAMCIFLQYIVSTQFLDMPISVATSSTWFPSSLRLLEIYGYSFVLFPAPRRWQFKSGFRKGQAANQFVLADESLTRYGSGPRVARQCFFNSTDDNSVEAA